jgi:hypothetical protein
MASAPPLIGAKTASSSIWKSNPKAFSERLRVQLLSALAVKSRGVRRLTLPRFDAKRQALDATWGRGVVGAAELGELGQVSSSEHQRPMQERTPRNTTQHGVISYSR